MKKVYILTATPIGEELLAAVEAESFQEAADLLGARLVKRLTKGDDPSSYEMPSWEIDFSLEEVEKNEQWIEIPASGKDRDFQRKGVESLELNFYRFSYAKNSTDKLALSCKPFKLIELPLIK